MTSKLSKSDVDRLLTDPFVDAQADAVAKIATRYDAAADFGEQEKKLAAEIFSLMCKDVEERVRGALAANLKEWPFLPHDIARTLAVDVASVSDPILKFPTVLIDTDLIEIVKSHGAEKRKAIASRPSISPDVSGALIDIRNEAVVGTLVTNDGAEISTGSMQRVLDGFADSDHVKSSMVGRSALRMEVSARLVNMVSDKHQQELIARHPLPSDGVRALILQSR
jgi:uncharacterized protein (DUF2336 family)